MTQQPAESKLSQKLFRSIEENEWKQFLNWLLIWIVLANIGFAVMWVVGAPPRWQEIFIVAVVGLTVRRLPIWVRYLAFLAALIYSVFGFVAALFNLAMPSLLYSLQFFLEIDPASSPDYIIGACLLLFLSGLALRLIRRPQAFDDIRLVFLALLAAISLMLVDQFMGMGMRGHYKRTAEEGEPFVSAIELSKFGADVASSAPKRNFMLIVVESLGTPTANTEMKRLLFADYDIPAIADRYVASTGNTTYFNSTTAAEMRELCGRWGDYDEVLDRTDSGCLPARLAKAGFETSAYHSFTGSFFERSTWYPNIGFKNRQFGEQMIERGARECGGVFPGACDRDVPALLAKDLKASKKPQFIYWLTVNSHLPVPEGMNLEVDDCARISEHLAQKFPMICRQFALWDQLDRAIIKEITASDFPPTDILIVGDHMPPYFDRHHRSQFAPDRVPWLLLKWKGGEVPKKENAVARKPEVANDATG